MIVPPSGGPVVVIVSRTITFNGLQALILFVGSFLCTKTHRYSATRQRGLLYYHLTPILTIILVTLFAFLILGSFSNTGCRKCWSNNILRPTWENTTGATDRLGSVRWYFCYCLGSGGNCDLRANKAPEGKIELFVANGYRI